MNTRHKRIQKVVSQLLKKYGITSPPIPVDDIVRGEGIELRRQPEPDGKFSGLVAQSENGIVIGINENHSFERQRFTIAHELGHVSLHGPSLGQGRVDRQIVVRFRDDRIKHAGDAGEEREANLFAAELLMPSEFVLHDLEEGSLGPLDIHLVVEKLARRYRVSVQAMAIRLTQLGYQL
jgi:Zn-dependent peptidase ImmA (M78 family)